MLIRHEVQHHVGLEVAHRQADVFVENQSHGDCSVRSATLFFFLVGDAENDEHPALIVVITCAFVLVSNVIEKVVGHFQCFFEIFFVFRRGTCGLNPAVGRPFVLRAQTLIVVPICEHNELSSYFKKEMWVGRKPSSVLSKQDLIRFRMIVVHLGEN